ncbi:MAG: 23S rRNA (adenine(2030)-N(6))-methyltransferase RlmJ [Alphaproteobacteria bacterium]
MNYRHSFHAGNFADIIKHATLLLVMDELRAGQTALRVVDTHAGRGRYDVGGADASRSGEAKVGIGCLAEAGDFPAAITGLRTEIAKLNPAGGIKIYPGSPELIANRLRPGDSYLACELRAEEHSVLANTMQGRAGVKTACVDGFQCAAELSAFSGETFFLIDPPFERADDYAQTARTLRLVAQRSPGARFLIWLPLKDLETFDSFVRSIEDICHGSVIIAEARMRPLADPLKMNGCVLVLVNFGKEIEAPVKDLISWVVKTLGENGEARVWRP